MSAARYHVLTATRQGAAPLPHGKHVPFDWPAFSLRRGAPATFKLDKSPGETVRLRLTVAVAERENKLIEAVLPETGRVLGTFDLRAPAMLQTLEISLEPSDGPEIGAQGLELRVVSGEDPIWFFGFEAGGKAPLTLQSALLPHVLEMPPTINPMGEFYLSFGSLASLQPFGPKEAAVLDGLTSLSRQPGGGKTRTTLNQHLGQFFDPMSRLRYEDARSMPVEGAFSTIDCLAPLATLAQIDGGHPALKIAMKFMEKYTGSDGLISDGPVALADAYALAPLLASLAKGREGGEAEKLGASAFIQLQGRHDRLVQDETFWGVGWPDGRKQGHNRALVLAFWTLALVYTLDLLPLRPEATPWRTQLLILTQQIVSHQRKDGLWNAFFAAPDEEQPPDLAASAGLALALGAGVRAGFVPMDAYFAANRASVALRANLSPDGFLVQPPVPGSGDATGQFLTWAMGWQAALIASLQ